MIGNCAITGKRCYTKDEAKIALYRVLRRSQISPFGIAVYYCGWCNSHHVGNKYHA